MNRTQPAIANRSSVVLGSILLSSCLARTAIQPSGHGSSTAVGGALSAETSVLPLVTVLGLPSSHDLDDDHITDVLDCCPSRPEDLDGFSDEDGCPDLDNDQDHVRDLCDQCPDEALSDAQLPRDAEGCLRPPQFAALRGDDLEEIEFPRDSASGSIDPVASRLCAMGNSLLNQRGRRYGVFGQALASEALPPRLARQRGEVVQAYLLAHGLEPERLEARARVAHPTFDLVPGMNMNDSLQFSPSRGVRLLTLSDRYCTYYVWENDNYVFRPMCTRQSTALPAACDHAMTAEESNTFDRTCPPPVTVQAAVSMSPGTSSRDPDDDGVSGQADQCPTEPEDCDGFRDEDGCPDMDNDGDGVNDVCDACPDIAEGYSLGPMRFGCPGFFVGQLDSACYRQQIDYEHLRSPDTHMIDWIARTTIAELAQDPRLRLGIVGREPGFQHVRPVVVKALVDRGVDPSRLDLPEANSARPGAAAAHTTQEIPATGSAFLVHVVDWSGVRRRWVRDHYEVLTVTPQPAPSLPAGCPLHPPPPVQQAGGCRQPAR